ncbi:MAG: molybdopterin-guanine dinucleotide biosynthesis protein A [Alphaproteobacteria bacterium]|nr:molybdopterin-guanine dinucleotide biosynthesis protein A [Alphaproteobacteria bacterium]
MWVMKHFAAAVIAASISLSAGAATADDRHAGYYYPVPQSTEVYKARAITLPDSGRRQRLAFVTGFALKQVDLPYPPNLAMFAKGEDAEKLIIVALDDGRMNTLYRARAVLAMLTARARVLPIFQEHRVEEILTFLDFCKMLGFEQVTVSDGKDFAHQIHIE